MAAISGKVKAGVKILKLTAKILTVILYVVTLMAAYGGYFNPAHWTLPAIGLLFFPYLAIISLIVSGIWLILRKFIIGCIGIFIILACGPTFLQAVPFHFPNEASDENNTFKMVTFNCLHMEDLKSTEPNTNRSLDFLINSGADFICLQELYSFQDGGREIFDNFEAQRDSLLKLYPYYSKDGWRELEFLSKYPFENLDVQLIDMKYGSLAAYSVNIDGRELHIVNVHLPSYLLSEKERQVITEANSKQGMKKSIKELEGSIYAKMETAFAVRAEVSKDVAEYAAGLPGNVIVCGDFNDVPGSWAYRNFTKRGFEDAYAQTGFGHMITYNQHLMLFHIDQILYRGDLVPLYVKKGHVDASDHYPLIAEFEFL